MNRCITCGKIVTRLKAQNAVEWDGHTYLVCCPLCEKEFNHDPDHYLAVARSLFGNYAVTTHSQGSANPMVSGDSFENHAELIHLIRNLKESFDALERSNNELVRHFDQISTSGGLEGLRNALRDHRKMMDLLHENMAVHAGVCRFVLSVSESFQPTTSRT